MFLAPDNIYLFAHAVAFRIYDRDGDGLISGEELYQTLHTLMGTHYSEAQLEQVRAGLVGSRHSRKAELGAGGC